jgi:hypothetical protein
MLYEIIMVKSCRPINRLSPRCLRLGTLKAAMLNGMKEFVLGEVRFQSCQTLKVAEKEDSRPLDIHLVGSDHTSPQSTSSTVNINNNTNT